MGKLPSASDTAEVPDGRESSPSSLMFVAAMADTMWRMFVPTVGLTLFGVWLDREWHTKPWCMILGIIIGTTCAVVLVRRQLNQSKRIGIHS